MRRDLKVPRGLRVQPVRQARSVHQVWSAQRVQSVQRARWRNACGRSSRCGRRNGCNRSSRCRRPSRSRGPAGVSGSLADLGCFEGQRVTWTGNGWSCSQDSTETPIGPNTQQPLYRVDFGAQGNNRERSSFVTVRGGGVRLLPAGGAVPRRLGLAGAMINAGGSVLRSNMMALTLQDAPVFSSRGSRVVVSSFWVNVVPGSSTRFQPGSASRVRIDMLSQGPAAAVPGASSEVYVWYQQSLATTPAPRRTLQLQFRSPASEQRYNFDDCVLSSWEPLFNSTGAQGETASVDCHFESVTSTGRPQLAAWLNEVIAGTTSMRTVPLEYLDSTSNPQRTLTYGSAFPVRYTFPVFDSAVSSPAVEGIELQSDTLTVQ